MSVLTLTHSQILAIHISTKASRTATLHACVSQTISVLSVVVICVIEVVSNLLRELERISFMLYCPRDFSDNCRCFDELRAQAL